MITPEELMDEFFETNQYDETGDWRELPETGEDPEEDEED